MSSEILMDMNLAFHPLHLVLIRQEGFQYCLDIKAKDSTATMFSLLLTSDEAKTLGSLLKGERPT